MIVGFRLRSKKGRIGEWNEKFSLEIRRGLGMEVEKFLP